MRKTIKRFMCQEHGGAVVDWVVITAGVVTLSITLMIAMTDGTQTVATKVNTSMENVGESTTGG